MRYVLLIYRDEALADAARDQRAIESHVAMAREAVSRGAYLSSNALQPTVAGTTVRVREGRTILSDGPFADTKEALAGYYLLDCEDLDDAIHYAERIPASWEGSVEVRPVNELPGWDEAIGLGARTP